MVETATQSSSPAGAGLAGLALALFAWASVVGVGQAEAPAAILAVGLLVVACVPGLDVGARFVALVATGAMVLALVPVPPIWPLAQLVVVFPAVLALVFAPRLRVARTWFSWGHFDPVPIAVLGGAAAIALPLWVALARPDLSSAAAMLPAWPLPLMLGAALGFAVLNAIVEEVIFRGIIQGALESSLGPRSVAPLVLQGAAFGVMHWHGFPSGLAGAVLAGTWGIVLGWARRRTGGLLTPVLGHIVADAVIFALLWTQL